jgi:hypothetical protein
MRKLALLFPMLLPGALLGCAGAAGPQASLRSRCEAQINADPEIRNLTLKYAGSTNSPAQAAMFDPRPLREVKMKACLQGYPVNGGVEPVKHPDTTFDLF